MGRGGGGAIGRSLAGGKGSQMADMASRWGESNHQDVMTSVAQISVYQLWETMNSGPVLSQDMITLILPYSSLINYKKSLTKWGHGILRV